MEFITSFDELTKRTLNKYVKGPAITIGILIADYRQNDVREYILNYLNRLDTRAGNYIDIYLPGYYLITEKTKEKKQDNNFSVYKNGLTDMPVLIKRTGEQYHFNEYLFEDFLLDIESKMKIDYTYNPMLLLVEIDGKRAAGQLQYQRKMVIELDNDSHQGIKRTGCLFDEIFKIAKKEVNLDEFNRKIKMNFFKECAIQKIAQVLDGKIIEVIGETMGQTIRYRIK